jgi:high-affinity iron transporter
MLSALSVTLRESLSALLVVAVVLAYVARADRTGLRQAIRWGVALSLPMTGVAAVLFAGAANQALWEGVLALLAAASVAWVTAHLWRLSRAPASVESSVSGWALFCIVTIVLIVRGGMEIALLIGTMVWHVPAFETLAGASLGPALAIGLGIAWSRAGRHVPQRVFAQVTFVFLVVLFVHLLIDGLHEMSEANAFAGAGTLHRATAMLSSDGAIGGYVPYLLIAMPLAWWLVALFWEHAKTSAGRVADVDR